MLFSILIPVYNVEKYLVECLNSVINQTEQDYEIVLIDDGSTDSSGEICDSFAEQYPDKITVKHNKNQGLIATRVELIKAARGNYLVHIDSDDTLRLDTLMLLRKAIEQYQPDMIIYGLRRIDLDGTSTDQVIMNESKLYEGSEKTALYRTMCSTSKLNNYVTKVVRRELTLSSGFFLNYSQVKIGEDLLQSLPVMTNAKKIYYLAEPLYYYRKNVGSMTLGGARNRYESESIVFAELTRYAKLWGLYDEIFPVIQRRYISMCLDVLFIGTMKKQNKEEYANLFHRISKDDFFISARDSITKFSSWKKVLWKLAATDKRWMFEIMCWIIGNISKIKSK